MASDQEARRRAFLAIKPGDEPKQPLMSPDMKEEMLKILIRNQDAFLLVKDKLTADKLMSWSHGHAAVWKLVLAFYQKHGELPPEEMLVKDLQYLINCDTGEIRPGDILVLDRMIEQAFDPGHYGDEDIATSRLCSRRAVEFAIRFLQEGTAGRLAARVSDQGGVANDLPALLQKYHAEAADVQAIAAPRSVEVFPDGWDTKNRHKLFSTGFSTLDYLLNYQRAGEVTGVLGMSGVCKTTLAVMAVVNMAEYCAVMHMQGGIKDGRRPVVYYVTYETDRQEFGERCIACRAGIKRDVLIEMDSMLSLPGPDDPIPTDDQVKFSAQIETKSYVCQRQRALAAIKLINDYVVFVDFSAMDPTAPVDDLYGTGGIAEIDAFISRQIRENDTWPLVLWLDHISGMVDMIEDGQTGKDKSARIHREIAKAPMQARRRIAKKYECPVWLIHQFSGEANAKKHGTPIFHTDAEGSKLFVKACDYMICIGRPNGERLVAFEATKTRRTGPKDSAVVRIVGEYNQLIDARSLYAVDPLRRSILLREDIRNAPGQQTKQAAVQAQERLMSKRKLEGFS